MVIRLLAASDASNIAYNSFCGARGSNLHHKCNLFIAQSSIQRIGTCVCFSLYFNLKNLTPCKTVAQYFTPSQPILGRGTYNSTITLKGLPNTNIVDDNDIKAYLFSLVKSGVIMPTKDSYYPIHFAPKIRIVYQGSASCQVFCGYHSTIDISSLNIGTEYLYYGVMPDPGDCANGCGGTASLFENLCSVSSHELVEAVTDPAVGLVTFYGPPLAWYSDGGEISDICNGQRGTIIGGDGKSYTVQKEWSNLVGKCALL
jgi:hypothetical protein